MNPIGNDIVDLTNPLSIGKSRNRRFLERVFTLPEQSRIVSAAEPDRTLWALWAAKETAFKIVRKCRGDASFLPKTYAVALTGSIDRSYRSGLVDIPCAGGPVHVSLLAAKDYIHCLGSMSAPDRWDDIFWKVDRCIPAGGASNSDLSLAGRDRLMRHLSVLLNCRMEDLEIRRFQEPSGLGPPRLYLKGKQSPIDISLSHDGVHTAYAFRMA